MGHLLYLMFRCNRGCDGKFGKFENFVASKHTQCCACPPVTPRAGGAASGCTDAATGMELKK